MTYVTQHAPSRCVEWDLSDTPNPIQSEADQRLADYMMTPYRTSGLLNPGQIHIDSDCTHRLISVAIKARSREMSPLTRLELGVRAF